MKKIFFKKCMSLIIMHIMEAALYFMVTIKEIVPIYVNNQKILANEIIRLVLYILIAAIWLKSVWYLIGIKKRPKKRQEEEDAQ